MMARGLVIAIAWVLATACADDESSAAASGGTTGSGGSGAAGGTTASGGTTGNRSEDAALADGGIVLRACDPDVPCNPGARCEYRSVDTTTYCVCDPSGHFICDAYHDSTADTVCLPGRACRLTDGGTCTAANAFCAVTCGCQSGVWDCSYACSGSGPERDGRLCGDPNCQVGTYRCEYEDGTCSYSVTCGGPVTGRCE